MGTQYGPENTCPVRRFGEGGGSAAGLLSLPDANLNNVLWVDVNDTCPPASADGSCQQPFQSIDVAVNAAALLLPTVTNPVAIIIMPGEYQETVNLDVPYCYLFGWSRETTILRNGAAGTGTDPLIITTRYTSVQGITCESEDTSVNAVEVNIADFDQGYVEFRECCFQVAHPPNGGDGSVHVLYGSTRWIDCDFVGEYTTTSVLTSGPGAVYVTQVELYACRFYGSLHPAHGNGAIRVYGCEIDGQFDPSVAYQIYDTRITTAHGAAVTAANVNTFIQDCVLTSEAGNYDIDDDTGGFSFDIYNVTMWTGGVHENHSLNNPTRYVGGPGDADWYQTTWHAQRTGAPRLIILLKDDTITSALNNYQGNPTTIRGNGHTLTANGCELVTQSSIQWIRFEHIYLVGRIYINNAGSGARVDLLEGTYLTGDIYFYGCANNNMFVTLDGVEMTGTIIFEDWHGYGQITIKRSRIKPSSGAAVWWKDPGPANPNPNQDLRIKYSTLWNAGGGAASPFVADGAFAWALPIPYRSHHSRYNVQPAGASFNNVIAVAQRFDSYDVQTDY